MSRIQQIAPETTTGRTRELFDTVQQAFGMVPNTVRVMANSPAVLDSFLAFSTAMGGVGIGTKLHNQLKLTTSETNSCSYCTSILSAIAPSAGLSVNDILAGRTGQADDRATKAALSFANDVLETRGNVTDQQLAAVRGAGFDDADIVEMVASVVLGCFTNFLNNVADTDLDIPRAESIKPRATAVRGNVASVTH